MPTSDSARGAIAVALVFFSTAICTGSGQYAFGYFIQPLEDTFGWSRTEISASLSFAAVSGLAAPLLGRLMDRIGARPIMVFCLTLTGLSLVVRPFMSELWHWYVLSFFQFIGYAGATVLPTGKLVAAWYPIRRGRVMAIAVMGNNFGGLTLPGLVAVVLAYATWREGFVAMGVLAFIVAGLALALLRESPTDGATTTLGGGGVQAGRTVSEALRTPAFYVALTVVGLGYFTYSAVLPHIAAHLINRGMSVTSATLTLNGVALGGLLGKILFGYLCERLGARRATIANLTGQTLLVVLLGALESPSVLYFVAPLFGICMGGFGVVHTLYVQDTFGLTHFGAIMGLLNATMVVSFGLGPVIAGLSFDWTGSYGAGFAVAGALFATAAATLVLSRP